MIPVRLISVGKAVPSRTVSSDSLDASLGRPSGYTFKKSGVRSRFFAAPDESQSQLGAAALRDALANASLPAGALDLLISACGVPEQALPNTACFIAAAAGLPAGIEPNPFLRQTPFHAWAPQYRYQHLYWPLVAALSLPYLAWYSDWLDFFGLTPAGARDRSGWRGRVVFLACKAAHVLLVLALPLWALHGTGIGWFVVPLAYLLGQMLASCFLVAAGLLFWRLESSFDASSVSKL